MPNQRGCPQNMSHPIYLACYSWPGVEKITGVHGSRALASKSAPAGWSFTCGFLTSLQKTIQGRLSILLSFCYPRGWSPSNQPSFLYLECLSCCKALAHRLEDWRSESTTGMRQSVTWDLLRDPLPQMRHF